MQLRDFWITTVLLLLSGLLHAEESLSIYKTETCGCCGKWVEHIQEAGMKADATNLSGADLNAKKLELGIKPEYQSCHVGVSKDGYVFEGHIPAYLVQKFLKEKPEDALGLAVPGMPVGSPGMEMGDKVQPYEVLMLMKDGSYKIFAKLGHEKNQKNKP